MTKPKTQNLIDIIPARLKYYREINHYTQREVADKLFMTVSNYQNIEQKKQWVSIETLVRLKKIYKLRSIERFLS